jgi:hypothetical protein
MSNLESLQNQFTVLISNLILTPLSDWLHNEKNIDVSVEQLLEILKSTKTSETKSTNVSLTTPLTATLSSIPSAPSSIRSETSKPAKEVVTLVSGGGKSRPKSKPPSTENYSGPTCKYVFKRGDLKGKECGKPAVSGTEYCEQCSTKKTNKPLDVKQTKLTEGPKPEGPKPEGPSKSEKETKTSVGFTAPLSKKVEKPKIELREIGSQPNTYIDTQTNIVVKKVVDKDKTLFVAVGVQEESGFRTLNEEEKKEALSRNFSLQNSEKSDKKIVSKQPVSNIPDIDDE